MKPDWHDRPTEPRLWLSKDSNHFGLVEVTQCMIDRVQFGKATRWHKVPPDTKEKRDGKRQSINLRNTRLEAWMFHGVAPEASLGSVQTLLRNW